MADVPTLRRSGPQLALPENLVANARGLADNALSPRTCEAYDACWGKFRRWCETHGRDALPATTDTLAAYIAWLATGEGGSKPPRAISTINQAVSAIKLAHQRCHLLLDTDDPDLQRIWKGARREIAGKRGIRRVSPIMSDDLRDVLEMLGSNNLREARDAALLALGWGAARRRSELVGHDWLQLGNGTGYLRADDRGLVVTLMTSKTSQEQAQEYVIARTVAPFLCQKIETWIEISKIARGTPLFRPIVKGKGGFDTVDTARLHVRSVPRIVKRRLYLLLKAQEAEKPKRRRLSARDLKAKVEAFSSHSLRAGHVTDAAERGLPDHHIMAATGHKTKAMLGVYARVTDAVKKSSLKGAGL